MGWRCACDPVERLPRSLWNQRSNGVPPVARDQNLACVFLQSGRVHGQALNGSRVGNSRHEPHRVMLSERRSDMKRLALVAVLIVAFTAPTRGGVEEGVAAYRCGDKRSGAKGSKRDGDGVTG